MSEKDAKSKNNNKTMLIIACAIIVVVLVVVAVVVLPKNKPTQNDATNQSMNIVEQQNEKTNKLSEIQQKIDEQQKIIDGLNEEQQKLNEELRKLDEQLIELTAPDSVPAPETDTNASDENVLEENAPVEPTESTEE